MSKFIAAVPPISYETYEQLLLVCREALPNEACGVLARGEESDLINIVYPIRNAHHEPSFSFAFDPAEWTAACFRMQKNRQLLVGFFHSHPRTAAIPSIRDNRGFLHESGLSYWIVSLANGSAPNVQPYRHKQGKFVPVPLVFA